MGVTGMQEKDIRAAILRVFEKHREKPGEAFQEDNFLDHLMADGLAFEEVRNGFAGVRRLNAFYKELQDECGVFLDQDDTEVSWPVDRLAERIARRRENTTAQVTFAKQRLAAAEQGLIFEPLKFGLFLILPAILVLWSFIGGWTVLFVLIALGAGVIFAIYRQQMKEVRHFRARLDKIVRQKQGK